MPADLFGRENTTIGGAMSADATRVTFANLTNTGLLLQSLNINYSQGVERLYALDTPYIYLVAGRTTGSMSAGQVIGPIGVTTSFYKNYSDVCSSTGNMTMTAAAGCHTAEGGKMRLTITNPIITTFGLSMTAQSMAINTNLEMTFVSMDLQDA